MIASPFALVIVGVVLVVLFAGILHALGVILVVVGAFALLVGYPAGWYGRRRPPPS